MVGILKRFSNKFAGSDEDTVDDYLDTLGLEHEHMFEEQADIWVKPFVMQDTPDAKHVVEEVNKGNVVLLNIEPLYKRNAVKLKQSIDQLKRNANSINGDIVRLSEYKLLVTPRGMKVFTKK